MATRVADRVLLDTNVLLAATDEGRTAHRGALAALNEWPGQGVTLYTSGQILREYLVVATRPVANNGLGLGPPDALANVAALRERLWLLPEVERVTERLLELLREVSCTGKQIHDACVVATMLSHGVETIVTSNLTDFIRFKRYIGVVSPDDGLS